MNSPISYKFDDVLAMSQSESSNGKVRDIVLNNIPGALNVHQSHVFNDRSGTDWWVEHKSGRHLSIDCKVRAEDWAAKPKHIMSDDVALESWSVIEKNIVGWTRDDSKRTDYILWLWTDTGRWLLIPFPMLCKVFCNKWVEWSNQYKTARQHTPRFNGGYHSECIFVPRRELWAQIYKMFGGSLNTR